MLKAMLISCFLFTVVGNASVNPDSLILVSSETEDCLMCHSALHPGIVASWNKSLHASSTPAVSMKKEGHARRISSPKIDENLKNTVVGCYECHGLNKDLHPDAFEHNGYTIHTIVSTGDCAVCHQVEEMQYRDNLMSRAHDNLMKNSVYMMLVGSVNGGYSFLNQKMHISPPNDHTLAESCLYCHGTKISITGMAKRETEYGDMLFPVLGGWPNQGVGRINPDGTLGSCSSCHPRHDFSVATARNPYTCSECHKGPDVPAFKVYEVSKHGNIFNSSKSSMNMSSVPWVIGLDFTIPTCATCHVSLIVDETGTVLAPRSHRFNDRLPWRLFGVPYAHPHPLNADVSTIKNKAGLPLPVELTGEPASDWLINKDEQVMRKNAMQRICNGCHSSSWTDQHFERLDNTIRETNALTLTATLLISEIWNQKLASGLPQNDNPFDEAIERDWTKVWLFHANSIRFTSAMAGGGDYGVFADGRFQLTEQIVKLQEFLSRYKKQ